VGRAEADAAEAELAEAFRARALALDGLVALPNGDFLVSSWDASGIYRGRPGGTFTLVIDGVKAPADIGYDPKRRRVLVPMFKDDEVRAYALE
jgi:hypothetical protein